MKFSGPTLGKKREGAGEEALYASGMVSHEEVLCLKPWVFVTALILCLFLFFDTSMPCPKITRGVGFMCTPRLVFNPDVSASVCPV